MQEELNMFAEYKEKLAGVVGDAAAAGIVAESLFLVCAGSDDIANNYYLAPVRPLQYDISAYVDFLVQQASDFMRVSFAVLLFIDLRFLNLSVCHCRR
jgi:hypothetical protein